MSRITDSLSELTAPNAEQPILDVSYPPPRVKIAPWQALVVAAAAIIAVLLWLAFSSQPEQGQLPPIEAAEQTQIAPAATSEEALPAEVVVSVVGAVKE